MYCTYCGNELPQGTQTCSNCGHPVGAPSPANAAAQAQTYRQTESLAVASLVLALAGFVVCPVVCSVIAVVLGYRARRRLNADPALDGEGLAKAGIILGWIGIGVGAIVIIGFIVALAAEVNMNVPGGIDALGRMG